MAFSRKKNRKKSTPQELPMIFPLSANPDLSESDMSGLDVYKKYLSKAFDEFRIRNIVITGDFGVGKSSIIRAFEKTYLQKESKFLYISLGDFLTTNDETQQEIKAHVLRQSKLDNHTAGTQQNIGGRKSKRKKAPTKNNFSDDDKQQNVLERRILLQIYARFRRKDLPASGFKMIQEHNRFWQYIVPLGCGFVTVIIFLLGLSLTPISIFNFPTFTESNKINGIYVFYIILYLLLMVTAAFAVSLIVHRALPKLQAKALTLKTNTIEASYENDACNSYIDQHATDLVYCLEQVAEAISHTVVFEDMDRLDPMICTKIFTRLREINYLVNLRFEKKNTWLRFVYIANDNLISQLNPSKFFDYVLTVVPRLNPKTAEQILVDNLIKVHNELNAELNVALTPSTGNSSSSETIHRIAPFLSDYRLQYTILNDYSLWFRLYYKSNKENCEDIAENIFAFAVYKNFFPEDYSQIKKGKSSVFPRYQSAKFYGKNQELLNVLTGEKQSLLIINCLYFAGYSKKEIVDLWHNDFKNNLEATLSFIQEKDREEAHEALKNYCAELSDRDAPDCYRPAIRYMVNCPDFRDWDWVFHLPVIFVLEILSALDDAVLHSLFNSAGLDLEGDKSIFEKCSDWDYLDQQRDLSLRELEVLCMGTGNFFNKAVWIVINDEIFPRQLQKEISNYWESHQL